MIAEDEARRTRAEWDARRVVILVLDPALGALLAMSDDDPGRPILPGSVLKPITVALALDAGAIDPARRFDCAPRAYDSPDYGTRTLHDATPHGFLDARQILAVSSNVGMSRIFDALGGRPLALGLQRFHLDGAPAIMEDATFDGAIVAIGQRFATTPLALAAAYGAIANDGVYVSPGAASRHSRERIISESTARTVRGMLEEAVSGAIATGKLASVPGVRVAGKTGTSDASEIFASFVGMVPTDHPRYVILVGVAGPKKPGTGGSIATPAFARVAKRLLSI